MSSTSSTPDATTKPQCRWYQVRLHTLLIVMEMVGVASGFALINLIGVHAQVESTDRIEVFGIWAPERLDMQSHSIIDMPANEIYPIEVLCHGWPLL